MPQPQPLHSESREGLTLNIYQDEFFEADPNAESEDIQFVHFHRDFFVESEAISEDDTRRFYQGEKIEQEREYWIFPVTSYIHSGVVLYLGSMREAPFDPGGWDTSHVGAILLQKKCWRLRRSAYKAAAAHIEYLNSLYSGEVYGYDVEGGESVWGFVGDIKYCIQEGRASMEYTIKKRRKQHAETLKAQIRHRAPLEARVSYGRS